MQQLAKSTFTSLKQTSRLVFSNRVAFSDRFKNKEQAEEKMFFDKEERRVISNLLKKLEGDARIQTKSEVAGKDEEIYRAKVILERYKVQPSQALLEELYDWKHE